MKPTLGYFGVVATFVALSLGACGDDAADLPPGNLALSWLVGTSNCAAVGVETVAVIVDGSDSVIQTYDCNEEGALLTDLQAGAYTVRLRGEDSLGVERFGVTVQGVEVRSGGTTTVPTVRLLPIPAVILVSWYFDNGRMCTQNDVDSVELILWDGVIPEVTLVAPCSDAESAIEIEQAGAYEVEVAGRDADGLVTFRGQSDVVVNYGDDVLVEVRLEPRSGGISTRE